MSIVNLADRALLAQLSISQWNAKKFDKKVSEEVARNKGVSNEAGRYNKSLLPGDAVLKLVHSKSAFVRSLFYQKTLPWGVEGTQILPSAIYFEFMTEFRTQREDWEKLVDQFVSAYPRLKYEAETALGPLFSGDDYPDETKIRDKFRMDLTILPVPSAGDFRVALIDEEMDVVKKDVTKRVKEAQAIAMQEVWKRLYDRVKHVAEKLQDPEAIFRDSMIENVRDTCELLKTMNIMDDPNLEVMRAEVEESLIMVPDTLRANKEVRQATAEKANDIMARMEGWMWT